MPDSTAAPGDAVFTILPPDGPETPLVVASGHSGAIYPPDFLAAARLSEAALRHGEDSYVDRLCAAAPSCGAHLLLARFPRVFCDVNREPWELDPAMFAGPLPAWVNTTSPRALAGLGTIARVSANGEIIHRRPLGFAEAEARVRACWEPYHAALAELIAAKCARFGGCVLLDAHSMPQAATVGRRPPPDIVLGDARGTSCAAALTALVERRFAALGYAVMRNEPYAGGYVTRFYGRPARRVHALQIELARRLYMDEATLAPHAGFDRLADDLGVMLGALAAAAETILAA